MFSRFAPHATALAANGLLSAFILYLWSLRLAKADYYTAAGAILFAVVLYIPWGMVLDSWADGDSGTSRGVQRLTLLTVVFVVVVFFTTGKGRPLAGKLPLMANILIGQHVLAVALAMLKTLTLFVGRRREAAAAKRTIDGFYKDGDSFESELPDESGQTSGPKKRGGGTVLDMVGRDED